ncbi:smf Mn2+ and Fe2+ transporter [Chiua virens]|nr:smf Mn2+ and Fe2+ transporter [Chiua virens]
MSPAVVPTEDQVSRSTPPRAGWSTKLYHVGWRIYHHATKHTGVGIVCAVAYFDPGNWSVDLQAGSQYGYALLFVVLLSGIFATFLQVLAARLGVVTGLDLASHCRLLFHDRPRHKLLWRWGVLYPLYALAEIAIVSTDLAELLGSGIALVLLFPALPLWAGLLLTASDVMLILAIKNPLESRPVRLFEAIIATLVLSILICMILILSRVTVNWGNTFFGYIPSKELVANGSLYTAVGIIGATVMPHSLFLGSHLATQDRLAKDPDSPKFPSESPQMTVSQRMLQSIRRMFSWRRLFSISRSDETRYPRDVLTHADRGNSTLDFIRAHIYHGMADVIISLMGLAVIINSALLILSSAVFYYNSGAYGSESPASLFEAHSLIKDAIGKGAALLFALALLASGQSASIIATVAGQSVSEGFLRWKVSPTLRRLITRALGLIPSVIVACVMGENGINALLVGSQVVLSIVLPFIMFPLVYLTSSSRIMSVKSDPVSPAASASPEQLGTAASPPHHDVNHAATMTDKESGSQDQVVNFSNGRIVSAVGYFIALVILVADVYALATL